MPAPTLNSEEQSIGKSISIMRIGAGNREKIGNQDRAPDTEKHARVLIEIHAAAPAKPVLGASCNGCGLCCAAEPCPVSRLLLGHLTGHCPALTWNSPESRYLCGMVVSPVSHLRWLPAGWNAYLGRRFQRWIAAGKGCDFDAVLIEPCAETITVKPPTASPAP